MAQAVPRALVAAIDTVRHPCMRRLRNVERRTSAERPRRASGAAARRGAGRRSPREPSLESFTTAPSSISMRRRVRAATAGSWETTTTGQPVVRQSTQQRQDLRPLPYPEGTRRFVRQHDPAAVHERTRDGDALLFSSRQFRRQVIHAVAEPECPEKLAGPRGTFRPTDARIDCRQLDVALRGEGVQQSVVLEYEAHFLSTQPRPFRVVEFAHVAAAEQVAAPGWPVQAAENVEQRRLAGSGWTDDAHEFTGPNGKGHPIERPHRADIRLERPLDALEFDQGGCGAAFAGCLSAVPVFRHWRPRVVRPGMIQVALHTGMTTALQATLLPSPSLGYPVGEATTTERGRIRGGGYGLASPKPSLKVGHAARP